MYKVKTNCEGCLFAEYDKKGKEQVACKLDRIPTFNPTFTKEKKDKDSKKCFVFDRFCNAYRPDEWLEHITEEEKKDLKATVMDEVCPRMGFFIFLRDSSEDAISDMKKRLDELRQQTVGAPRYICIINPKVEYNEELQEMLASSFDFEQTEYYQTHPEEGQTLFSSTAYVFHHKPFETCCNRTHQMSSYQGHQFL